MAALGERDARQVEREAVAVAAKEAEAPVSCCLLFNVEGEERVFSLDREVTQVGRDGSCDVVLPIRSVSRHHAEVRRLGGALVLVDLESTNGTFVNGSRVSEAPLRRGDEVRFARLHAKVWAQAEVAARRQTEPVAMLQGERRMDSGQTMAIPPAGVLGKRPPQP